MRKVHAADSDRDLASSGPLTGPRRVLTRDSLRLMGFSS